MMDNAGQIGESSRVMSDLKQRGKFIHTLLINHNQTKSFRYLKLKVKNVGKVPSWHEAAGSDAWIFIDEIIVK